MNLRFGILAAFIVLALIIASALKAFGQAAPTSTPIEVMWDPSPSADVAGYRLREGSAPGKVDRVANVGKTTRVSIVLTNLPAYLTVTAYSSNGLESVPSNEIVVGPRPEPAGNARWIAVVVTVTNWIAISP